MALAISVSSSHFIFTQKVLADSTSPSTITVSGTGVVDGTYSRQDKDSNGNPYWLNGSTSIYYDQELGGWAIGSQDQSGIIKYSAPGTLSGGPLANPDWTSIGGGLPSPTLTSDSPGNGTTTAPATNPTTSTGPGSGSTFTLGLPLGVTGAACANGTCNSFADYFTALITLGIEIAGGISVILIIYAGFMYAQSGGNAQKANNAKELVSGALIGMAILLLIRVILPTLGITTK